MWVLVIVVVATGAYNMGTGVAIDQVEFVTKQACETAQSKIRKDLRLSDKWGKMRTTCISKSED